MSGPDLTPEWRRFNDAVLRIAEVSREASAAADAIPDEILRWSAALSLDAAATYMRNIADRAMERHPKPGSLTPPDRGTGS